MPSFSRHLPTLPYTQILNLKAWKSWSWEIFCLLVYFALAANQLFLKPITGMANNGDFPKVLGPRSICDPNGERDAFAYVDPRYSIRLDCRWDSQLPSSESLFVRLIKLSARWTGRDSFAITGAGKVHLIPVLAALFVLLWALHDASPAIRFGVPPVAIFIFSDVAYVAYLNSFYMDVTSLVFILPAIALAAAWIVRPRTWVAIAFGVAGVLLALSKTQHAITGFLLAAMAAWFSVRAFREKEIRKPVGRCWAASAVAVAIAAMAIIRNTPEDYKAEPLYSLVFFRLLPNLPNRVDALSQLGLPAADLAYSGTHAYSKDAPVMNKEWRFAFISQLTYLGLGTFYLRNPKVLFQLIGRGLREDVFYIRPPNIGNYERDDGFPPATLARRFDLWSGLRSWLLRVFPAHVVAFYLVMGIGSLLCCFRRTWSTRWPLYPVVLVLAVSGSVEYLFPVLLDGTETARHLFFFHVITELLVVCAFSAIPGLLSPRQRTA
jgi:hypothetical protein